MFHNQDFLLTEVKARKFTSTIPPPSRHSRTWLLIVMNSTSFWQSRLLLYHLDMYKEVETFSNCNSIEFSIEIYHVIAYLLILPRMLKPLLGRCKRQIRKRQLLHLSSVLSPISGS